MVLSSRQKKILQIIQEQKKVLVAELAESFNMTEASIRLDLKTLEHMDYIKRFHGGARIVQPSNYNIRISIEQQIKRKIAGRAISYIEPRETLFLDSGTTVLMLAQALIEFDDLTIVTNSIPIATQVGREQNNSVVLAGGSFNYGEQCCEGLMTEKFLDNFSASKAFIGADSVDVHKGLFSNGISMFGYVQKIMHNSKETILLVDSSKFSKVGAIKICDMENLDIIITDSRIPDAVHQKLTDMGIQVDIV
jgi:DeoR/GlpR family transcriptional regulator of sugar metabolism